METRTRYGATASADTGRTAKSRPRPREFQIAILRRPAGPRCGLPPGHRLGLAHRTLYRCMAARLSRRLQNSAQIPGRLCRASRRCMHWIHQRSLRCPGAVHTTRVRGASLERCRSVEVLVEDGEIATEESATKAQKAQKDLKLFCAFCAFCGRFFLLSFLRRKLAQYFLAVFYLQAQFFEAVFGEGFPCLVKNFLFFLLDMAFHPLDEVVNPAIEFSVRRAHGADLVEQFLHRVVFFHRSRYKLGSGF